MKQERGKETINWDQNRLKWRYSELGTGKGLPLEGLSRIQGEDKKQQREHGGLRQVEGKYQKLQDRGEKGRRYLCLQRRCNTQGEMRIVRRGIQDCLQNVKRLEKKRSGGKLKKTLIFNLYGKEMGNNH